MQTLNIACLMDEGLYHHLDHFVPVSEILDIPLFVLSESDLQLAKKWYPMAKNIEYLPQDDTLFTSLSERCDIAITTTAKSSAWYENTLPFFTQKKLFSIYLPHGHSDKGYSSVEHIGKQPYRMVYGPLMLSQLQLMGLPFKKTLQIGNMRKKYYEMHAKRFDALFPLKLNPNKKTILYAPTWKDFENSSSIDCTADLLSLLKNDYTLIVKLHPFLEKLSPHDYYRIEALCDQYENVHFLHEYPSIYPLLSKVDFYVGDYSSIGYDFLSFDKPLFFLPSLNENKKEEGKLLKGCGIETPPNETLLLLLNDENSSSHFSAKRKALYQATFGETPLDLKEQILTLYHQEQKLPL